MKPIHLRSKSPVAGVGMTPWVMQYASRLEGIRVPDGIFVMMSAHGPRGPFVANVLRNGELLAHEWRDRPETALRASLLVAGVALCETCGEPDDGFHWTTHATTVRVDGEGYVREIEP